MASSRHPATLITIDPGTRWQCFLALRKRLGGNCCHNLSSVCPRTKTVSEKSRMYLAPREIQGDLKIHVWCIA